MPTATSYTSKIRYLSVAKNVKVQLPGGVSNTFRPGLSDMCSDFKTTTPTATTTTGGIITTIAGNGTQSLSGDGGLAVNATIRLASCVVADKQGNVFYADTSGSRSIIRKIDTNGILTDIGIVSNDFPITSFTLDNTTGDIYFCNSQAIYKLILSDSEYTANTVYTVEGVLSSLSHIAFDTTTNTFIVSTPTNANIYRITSGTATIMFTIQNAGVSSSRPITVDSSGNIYVTRIFYSNIKKSYTWFVNKYNPSGPTQIWSVDCGNATISGTGFTTIFLTGIAIGPKDGNVYVSSALSTVNRIFFINQANLSRSTFVGGGSIPPFSGDGGLATQSNLHFPTGIAFDSNSNLFICDQSNYRIRKVTPFETTTTLGKTTYNPPWFAPVEYRELCDCTLLTPTPAASAPEDNTIIFSGQ